MKFHSPRPLPSSVRADISGRTPHELSRKKGHLPKKILAKYARIRSSLKKSFLFREQVAGKFFQKKEITDQARLGCRRDESPKLLREKGLQCLSLQRKTPKPTNQAPSPARPVDVSAHPLFLLPLFACHATGKSNEHSRSKLYRAIIGTVRSPDTRVLFLPNPNTVN